MIQKDLNWTSKDGIRCPQARTNQWMKYYE